MVLFDEDPVTLIRQTTLNFHTTSDLSSLDRITSSLSTLHSARQLRLNAHTHSLTSLNRKLHHLSRTYADEVSSHDAGSHAQRILSLDTEKFRVAKQASEAEIEGERLGSELRGLKHSLEVVEKEGVEGGKGRGEGEDETLLRLRVYRNLGIEVEQDAEGRVRRAVVKKRGKAEASVVAVDEVEKVGPFFYTEHFWGAM